MPTPTYAPLTANDFPAAQAQKPDTSLNSLQEDAGGNLLVDEAPVSSLAGAGFAAVTAAAEVAGHAGRWVLIQAHPDNTKRLLVGSSNTVFPVMLLAGGSVILPISNSNLLWVMSEDGSTSIQYSVLVGS